mmetsp:Transcript_19236/g.22265  ORF Transcript_19236/g.22265 Transcript_19236/m.22265 type:complete len:233 (+) Transcript_19236:260-958(+)
MQRVESLLQRDICVFQILQRVYKCGDDDLNLVEEFADVFAKHANSFCGCGLNFDAFVVKALDNDLCDLINVVFDGVQAGVRVADVPKKLDTCLPLQRYFRLDARVDVLNDDRENDRLVHVHTKRFDTIQRVVVRSDRVLWIFIFWLASDLHQCTDDSVQQVLLFLQGLRVVNWHELEKHNTSRSCVQVIVGVRADFENSLHDVHDLWREEPFVLDKRNQAVQDQLDPIFVLF